MSIIRINWNPPRRTLRQFGVLALAVFGGAAAWVAWRHTLGHWQLSDEAARTAAFVLAGVAAACGALALVAPAALRWVYIGLTVVTFPIGFVVSHLILGVIYFGIFTPMALFFRLTGRDALARAFSPQAQTYWVPRDPPTDIRRYFRQY